MRIALLKVGEIGLDRCLGRYMALLPRVLLFSARGTLACLHVVAFVCSMLKHVAILAVGS
jgi:hypothetical protein